MQKSTHFYIKYVLFILTFCKFNTKNRHKFRKFQISIDLSLLLWYNMREKVRTLYKSAYPFIPFTRGESPQKNSEFSEKEKKEMKNSNKKGFTLVELLVVIAIVAILATVAIIGYTSFTKKAEETSDRSFVAQLNTAITRVDGGKYSIYEAAEVLKSHGFDISKIDATAKNQDILYANGQFFYSADGIPEGEIWIIDDQVHPTYSTYLVLPYGVELIETEAATNICVVTDGRNLTIKAPNANIEHHGEVADLTIESVALSSYHEFGRVSGIAVLNKGRVVVENGGAMGTLVVEPSNIDEVDLEGFTGLLVGSTEVLNKFANLDCETREGTLQDVADSGALIRETNVLYKDFTDALAACEEGQTIVLLKDKELEAPIVIEGKVVIDLNGKVLDYTSNIINEAMITNKGNLTINDSVGGGVINYNYAGANDPNYGQGNYTIDNKGTLTVNGGKITIANLRQHAKYPINNNSLESDAILVINGGWLYNYNTSAIRMICSNNHQNSVTINGGLLEGYCAIWLQNPNTNTVNCDLTITGGEIKTTAAAYVNGTATVSEVSSGIYCSHPEAGGAWSADSFIKISGGIFNENVDLKDNAPAVTVTGGTFNGRCEQK